MKAEKKREFTRRITNANRTELVVIMYEMCFEYMDDAVQQCLIRDIEGLGSTVRKGQQVIRRLEGDLDFDYELSKHLMSIYLYVEREMVKCLIDLDATHAQNVKRSLTPVYEGFKEISQKDVSSPLMDNTEAVYAGMTYGRGGLGEAVGASRRGFFA